MKKYKLNNTSIFNEDNLGLPPNINTLLGLGLQFHPHYTMNKVHFLKTITAAIHKFMQIIKLQILHRNNPPFVCSIPRISAENYDSITFPSENIYNLIDDFTITLIHNVNNFDICMNPSLLDRFMLRTIKQLTKNNNIIIKPADKNLGLCIIKKERYNDLCMNILSDTNTYNSTPDLIKKKETFPKLRKILNGHDKLWSRKRKFDREQNQLSYLAKSLLQLENNPQCRPARFYILPKMHKVPTTGRPIASCLNTPSYYTSVYLHNILYPLLKTLSNICLSSRSILAELNSLRLDYNENCILCADVKSLYPSIPIDFGLTAITSVLQRFPNLINFTEIPFIIDLLNWVLRTNYLEHDNHLYLQISGTAMGTPLAVAYANLVLWYIETDCLDLKPIMYKRYIDDLFVITKTEQQAHQIIDLFQSKCPSIQLDAITIDKKGIFLDLEIKIVESGLITYKIYQKPMNKYLYIPPTSAHSKACLDNFILNELQRYSLFNKDTSTSTGLKQTFFNRLLDRGYTKESLKNVFEQEKTLPTTTKAKQNKHKAKPIITIPRPKLKNFREFKGLFKFPNEIINHPTYRESFGEQNLIVGIKHFKTLSNYFLHKERKLQR